MEFEYQLDPDEVWGVLKPKGSAKVWDFWEVSFGKGFFGLWTKYNPGRNHQKFRMEGKYLLSRAKKFEIALKPRRDGKIGLSKPVCSDKMEQWQILDSCP